MKSLDIKRIISAASLAIALNHFAFGQSVTAGQATQTDRTKLAGEAVIRGGYGHTDPYKANLKFNVASRTIDFKSYAGVSGITPYSSKLTEAELYTFTGTAPLSENAGNVYLSTLYTEASGVVPHYGFSLGYNPGGNHRFTLEFDGKNSTSHENGTLKEGLFAEGMEPIKTHWSLNSPILTENCYNVNAGYEYTISEKDRIKAEYSFRHDGEEVEKQLNAISLKEYSAFSESLFKELELTFHHNFNLSYSHHFGCGDLQAAARYENRLARSKDHQWLDNALTLKNIFTHRYRTGAVMASYNYLPVKSLRLYAEFEYAYTSMNGRNLHDFLPRAIIEWHPDTEVLLSLKYDKLLVRPSLHYLNPAEVREPLAIRAGNSDIVGMHLHKISFDFDWKLPSLSAHLNASYLYTKDGFNAIWMERSNIRIYQWSNEGVRHAVNITPSLKIKASRTTEINASVSALWDKRIAESVSLSNDNWGVAAHADLTQGLPAGFRINVHGDISYGSTLDLYRRADLAYNFGGRIERSFGKHFEAAIDACYLRLSNDIILQGAYSGHLIRRPGDHYGVGVEVRYKF